jgi:glycosyltransferase involved in cell wall biosynthesis
MAPPWDQGDKNLAYTITRSLPGVNFEVLTAVGGSQPDGRNMQAIPVFRSGIPLSIQKAGVLAWLAVRRRDLARQALHFIYRPYPISSALLRLLPALRRSPAVHTVPATADEHPLDRSLFFAERTVTLSRYGQRRLQKLGVPNVSHIPPGIVVDEWAALAGQTDRLKARLGLEGRPVTLFPGHYGPGQGADIMLQAAFEICRSLPEARIIFACRLRSEFDRKREAQIRAEAAAGGIGANLVFLNTVMDMCTLIGASDLVALPLETLRDKVDIPITLLEAMAARKPVLISDLAPMNELIPAAGAGGEILPLGDSAALASAAIHLLSDPIFAERTGAAGQEIVRAEYDIRRVGRLYEQIYCELT